ncbi:hypothetical protein BDV12DRAFT_185354 [Aspergillus spectabilis]
MLLLIVASAYGLLKLEAWSLNNCSGDLAFTIFDDVSFTKNISNWRPSYSFQLSRELQGQEQLDLSLTGNLASWYANKDQLSTNSSSCEIFLQTYTAENGSTICHAVPQFTCHRLWVNSGL